MTAVAAEYQKGEWLHLTADLKLFFADQLISIVGRTYSRTRFGSFIRTRDDVMASNWLVYVIGNKVESCIFYRHERTDELWTGSKIQGIGHDGSSFSKTRVLTQLKQIVQTDGFWIETGGALRVRLLKDGVKAINDQTLLRTLFKDPNLQMLNDHTYQRAIGDNWINESSFGRPNLKRLDKHRQVY